MALFDSKKIAKTIFNELLNSNEKDINKLISNFFDFVKRNKLEKNLKNIYKYIDLEFKKYKDHNSVFIESPFENTKQSINDILNNTVGAQGLVPTYVPITENVNKKLIGGFVLRYKGEIYDASIKNKLDEIRKQIKS